MPLGKVKWYDAERGFGFLTNPDSGDCFVGKAALPEGVDHLFPGQRVEYDFVAGRKGPQVLRMKILDKPQHKYTPEEMVKLIADMVTILETKVSADLQAGRWPDHLTGKKLAEVMRIVAKELEA
ncbi:MAG: cold shock domain-containing protein [Corynebacterium sp.]|nr:cold shock domain-containing protein [Corynebacterium sp.]